MGYRPASIKKWTKGTYRRRKDSCLPDEEERVNRKSCVAHSLKHKVSLGQSSIGFVFWKTILSI